MEQKQIIQKATEDQAIRRWTNFQKSKNLQQRVKRMQMQIKELQDKYKGKSGQELVKEYGQNQELQKDVEKVTEAQRELFGVTKQQLLGQGVINPEIQKYIDKSLGLQAEITLLMQKHQVAFPQIKEKLKELQAYIADNNLDHISMSKLRHLLLLDDWSNIAAKWIPHIVNYGKPIIEMLYEKYIQPKLKELWNNIGGDEGVNPIDFQDQQQTFRKYTKVRGLNSVTTEEYINDSKDPDGVSAVQIACLIDPLTVQTRMSSDYTIKTALAIGSQSYSVVTNANGNCGFYITPHWNAGFYLYRRSADFDPDAGSGTQSSLAGPLSGQTAIKNYRLSALAIEFVPAIGTDQNGTFEQCTFYQKNFAPDSEYITRQSMGEQQTYSTGNLYTNQRVVFPLYRDNNDMIALSAKGPEEIFYYGLVTGGPSSATVGSLIITYVYEFSPASGSGTICPQTFATGGLATRQFLQQIFSQFPLLQVLTRQSAQKISAGLIAMGDSVNYSKIIQYLQQALAGISRPMNAQLPIAMQQKEYMSGFPSFDKIEM